MRRSERAVIPSRASLAILICDGFWSTILFEYLR